MKLAYFGNDMFSSCFDVFVERGHQICAVYVNPIEGIAANMLAKATRMGLAVRAGLPLPEEMNALVDEGVTLFFSAEYQHKIPTPSGLRYGVNLHTSMLPEGRGATPLPYLTHCQHQHSGLTLHKLATQFDQGDIIINSTIAVEEHDTLNSLMVKMHLQARELVKQFLGDIDFYYANAQPQTGGSYWPVPEITERLLDPDLTTVELQQRIKRFGHFGLFLKFEDRFWRVIHAEAVPYEAEKSPGELLFEHSEILAISSRDGFICILKHCLVEL